MNTGKLNRLVDIHSERRHPHQLLPKGSASIIRSSLTFRLSSSDLNVGPECREPRTLRGSTCTVWSRCDQASTCRLYEDEPEPGE